MKYDGKSTFTLSTGREFHAYGGVIGINQDATFVGGGHDDEVDWKLMRDKFHRGELSDNVNKDEFLTPNERIELASEMLQRWVRYRRKALDENRLHAGMGPINKHPFGDRPISGFIDGLVLLSQYIDPDAEAVRNEEQHIIKVNLPASRVTKEEKELLLKLGWLIDKGSWIWSLWP